MVIDCCLFAGEADMLELRLLTLKDVVDHFCVVACSRTHQGEPAEVHAIGEAFYRAASNAGCTTARLHWVTPFMSLHSNGRTFERPADERGAAGSIWFQKIEAQHRDGCAAAARKWMTDGDTIVMVSDVDEIPRPEIVADLDDALDGERWLTLAMRMHSTALDYLMPTGPWLGTCVSRLRDCQPQAQRDARTTAYLDEPECGVISDAGYHLSWMGTDAERARKLDTFSHAEHRGWDHAAGRRDGRHINGEQLIRQTRYDLAMMDWPKPIDDGSFRVPSSWRA